MIIFLANFVSGILSYRSLRKVQANQLTKTPPKAHQRLDKGHKYLGWFVVFLVVINVGLGFNLALSPEYARFWIPVVIGIFVLYLIMYSLRWIRTRHTKDSEDESEYQQKYQAALAQAHAQAAAARDAQPPRYEQNIPLQNLPAGGYAPYESVPLPRPY
jgi:amino acid transporter